MRLDKNWDFAWWGDPIYWYYHVYRKCLQLKNSYALYVNSVHLAFKAEKIDITLYILDDIKDIYLHAKLTFIMLCFCARRAFDEVYIEFQGKYRINEVERMGSELVYHIEAVGPRHCDTYKITWYVENYGECWWAYDMLGEVNRERCGDYIYFYLSWDICRLS